MFQSEASPKWRRLAARIGLYGGALFLVLPALFAHLMTSPGRAVATSDPPRRYDAISISNGDLRLRGWLGFPEPNAMDRDATPTVVIVHGLGDTLESYQEHAHAFLRRGFTVLLLDLRAHGRSDGSVTTLGGEERYDVLAAVDELHSRGLTENGVILLGHSMGAVAVILAGARSSQVKAVIAEAPFDSFRATVQHHAKLLYGLPSWVPLIPISIRLAEWRGRFDADEIDCVSAAKELNAPLLAIVDGEDRRMPESVIRRIVSAHSGPNTVWVADGVGHVGAFYHPDWEEQVFGFLEQHGLTP